MPQFLKTQRLEMLPTIEKKGTIFMERRRDQY
jgi:hypothetical protein